MQTFMVAKCHFTGEIFKFSCRLKPGFSLLNVDFVLVRYRAELTGIGSGICCGRWGSGNILQDQLQGTGVTSWPTMQCGTERALGEMLDGRRVRGERGCRPRECLVRIMIEFHPDAFSEFTSKPVNQQPFLTSFEFRNELNLRNTL